MTEDPRVLHCEVIFASDVRMAFVSAEHRTRFVSLVVKAFDKHTQAFPGEKPKAEVITAEIRDEAKTFLPWLAALFLQVLVTKLIEWLWNNLTTSQREGAADDGARGIRLG